MFLLLLSTLAVGQKINGVSWVGTGQKVGPELFTHIEDINTNYVALMPFGYGSMGSQNLKHGSSWQWWGEKEEGIRECASIAKQKDIQAMIKPQIWFDWGKYTGHFQLKEESEWVEFEKSYSDFILTYARVSEDLNLPVFCIGTELTEFAVQREDYWRTLIKDVRQIYKGKLTYAANWDSYLRIPFWDDLDMIGVDAYFPLSESKTPSVKEIQNGWKNHVQEMRTLSKRFGKQILFTEWGFRSIDYCGKEPWDYQKQNPVNLDAQSNAFEATFRTFWSEDWFAGGFVWKWFPNDSKVGGESNNQFTPQNKPAESIISEWFNAFTE
ncbi:MAG: glycoside hydrolase [Flavobacteriales bacterium]|nr:glycoside hydrolase [Flavobacteriales bacterium]